MRREKGEKAGKMEGKGEMLREKPGERERERVCVCVCVSE